MCQCSPIPRIGWNVTLWIYSLKPSMKCESVAKSVTSVALCKENINVSRRNAYDGSTSEQILFSCWFSNIIMWWCFDSPCPCEWFVCARYIYSLRSMKSGLWKEEHQGGRMTCSWSMLGSLCFHYKHFGRPGHICHEPKLSMFFGAPEIAIWSLLKAWCKFKAGKDQPYEQSKPSPMATLPTPQHLSLIGSVQVCTALIFGGYQYSRIYRVSSYQLQVNHVNHHWQLRLVEQFMQKPVLPQRQESISASDGQMAVAQRADPLAQPVERSETVIQDLRMAPGAPIEAGWPDSSKNNQQLSIKSSIMAWNMSNRRRRRYVVSVCY